jgi:inosose dehydratase
MARRYVPAGTAADGRDPVAVGPADAGSTHSTHQPVQPQPEEALMPEFLQRVAAAPISWGICEAPGWGIQLPVDRVLSEARGLGITAFEQGALGWLPTDPDEQRAKLDEYGITLLGGFVAIVLHDAARRDEQLAEADRIAATMAAAGGRFFVSCPVPALDDWHHPSLTDGEWSELLANLDRVAAICESYGLTQVVHPHLYTDIETAGDFQRFLDGCSSKFCFDTGHLTIGGADVVEIARRHLDRIGIVHLKDVDGEVARRERAGEFDLMGATQAGLFPSIGEGIVPIAEVVEILESSGYDGWYVMETDVALTDGEPPAGEGPVLGVARSLAFLRTLDVA